MADPRGENRENILPRKPINKRIYEKKLNEKMKHFTDLIFKMQDEI